MRNLTVILGSLRGGIDAFKSTIAAIDGDFALLIGKCNRNYWHEHAKYDWSIDEPDDWGRAFDEINGTEWRQLFMLEDTYLWYTHNFLGPCPPHQGSGGIQLYLRYQLLKYLKEIKEYDTLTITRSDCLWVDKAPVPKNDVCLVPNGEQYGGLTDRFVCIPQNLVETYLNMAYRIWFDAANLYDELKNEKDINTERYIYHHFCINKIPWEYFPYRSIIIKEPEDPSRWWLIGNYNEKLNHYIKYLSEFHTCTHNYGDFKIIGITNPT